MPSEKIEPPCQRKHTLEKKCPQVHYLNMGEKTPKSFLSHNCWKNLIRMYYKVESTFKSKVDSTSPVNWDILGTTGPIGLKFCVHLDFAVL